MKPSRIETRVGKTETKAEQSPYEKLREFLGCIAMEINSEYVASGENIVEGDCSINMESFQQQGLYSQKEILWDQQTARDNEISWASADNPRVQEFCIQELKKEYKRKYGKEADKRFEDDYATKTPQEIVLESQKKSYGSLLEMAITGIFYKILKPEFLVVRSADYDDQQNGVDHLIIRRADGALIGAFDEVNDERGGKRFEKKLERVKDKAQKGGSRIKYGITFEKGRDEEMYLVKKGLHNVPTFYLPLSTEELKDLLANMSYDIGEPARETEIKVFSQLVDFLKEQTTLLQNDQNVKGAVRDNLNQFASSLERMKEMSQRDYA